MLRTLVFLALTALAACRSSATPSSAPPAHPERLQVGFVIVDGVYNTELTAPYDIFQHSIFHAEPGMSVFTIGPGLAPVTTFEGLRILPDYTFADAPHIDVLVVPSAAHSMDTDLEDERLMEFVRARGSEARYVLSLCDGAFVLAAAGLLDGLRATTFPTDVARMREMFPAVDVLADVSFVHDGRAITSAGGALSFDPALYLAELLYGAPAARGMGRGLCLEWDASAIPHVVVPQPAGER